MIKKISFILLLSWFTCCFYGQEIKLKIIEKRGSVDIKMRDGDWMPLEGDIIPYGIELFTGFHSQVSIEVGTGSYVTVNQLSHIVLEKVYALKEEISTSIFLNAGYLIIYSKTLGDLKNRFVVNSNAGTFEFDNAGGEVYIRKDSGSVVKSFLGRIKVGSKFGKMYFINTGEVCGILPNGLLVESDYFLRRNMFVKMRDIYEERSVIAYYDMLFKPFTSPLGIGDYHDAFKP